MTRYDVIVIGPGQSGPSLAHRFARDGRRVAIIERKRFGGTCVNNGCIPTKSLIASARAAHVARRAADFGVVVEGSIRVDMKSEFSRPGNVKINRKWFSSAGKRRRLKDQLHVHEHPEH